LAAFIGMEIKLIGYQEISPTITQSPNLAYECFLNKNNGLAAHLIIWGYSLIKV
jgi:hypothetical protein